MNRALILISLFIVICCAFLMPQTRSSCQAQKPAAPAKWEYKVLPLYSMLKIVTEDKEGAKLLAKHRDKIRDPETEAVILDFGLNLMGNDGWELVSVTEKLTLSD